MQTPPRTHTCALAGWEGRSAGRTSTGKHACPFPEQGSQTWAGTAPGTLGGPVGSPSFPDERSSFLRCSPGATRARGEPWPSDRTCTPHAASHRAVRCGVALSRPAVMGARPSPDKAPETAQAPRQEAGAADSRHRTQRGWVCFSTAYPTAGGRAVYVRPNPEAQSLVSDMPPAPPSQVQRGGITGQLFSIVVLLNVLF